MRKCMDKKVIHTVLEDVVRKYPLRVAIESGNDLVTYSGLNRYANRLSHLLKEIGCGKDVVINVVIPSSIEWVTAMISVFKSGAIFLPMDLSFSRKRLVQVFKETFDGIIVTTGDSFDSLMALIRELD